MIYTVKKTSQFEKDYKLAIKRNKKMQKLHEVGDWLLIYQIKKDVIVLELTRTGTHSDLFGK